MDLDAFAAFEAAGWDDAAAAYDAVIAPLTARLAAPLLRAVEVTQGVRLLDVATGPGPVAGAALQAGASVVGLDVAGTMLALARTAHPRLAVVQGDAEQLPIADATFGAVVGAFVVLHLARPERAVVEMARVLAPGGRVALSVWDVPARSRFPGVFADAIAEVGAEPPPSLPAGPPFFRFADEAEFASLLEGAGLADVRVDTVSFTHAFPDAQTLWAGMLHGGVRTGATIRGQSPLVRRRIREAYDRLVGMAPTDRLELPITVKVASARR